jgi:hypothetical protein
MTWKKYFECESHRRQLVVSGGGNLYAATVRLRHISPPPPPPPTESSCATSFDWQIVYRSEQKIIPTHPPWRRVSTTPLRTGIGDRWSVIGEQLLEKKPRLRPLSCTVNPATPPPTQWCCQISTIFFQKTVFFSKICFGNPPQNFWRYV